MDLKDSLKCGHISDSKLDKSVELSGWVNSRRDHGGLIFIDLRDITGLVQIVFNSDFNKNTHNLAHDLRSEDVIRVKGKVVNRAEGTTNDDLATGKFEVTSFRIRGFK